jgi:hypothetical protein
MSGGRWIMWSSRLIAMGIAVVGIGLVSAPRALADCDPSYSIVPADGSFTYSVTPICDGSTSGVDIVTATPAGVVVTNSAGAVVTGPGATGYTRPGNTPYVNGAPDRSPYSNITLFTPSQAATARAQGNLSATANAYSQYGGFSPPAPATSNNNPPPVAIIPR